MTEEQKIALATINELIVSHGLIVEVENNVVIPKPPKG